MNTKADRMVDEQIASRGIRDPRVLQVMRAIPRDLFVPQSGQQQAYTDGPLSIGSGQTISQPYIVALMTEQLRLEGSERVLEIGTGCGYQTAVFAELAQEVFSIEIIPSLAQRARTLLLNMGYKNIHFRTGDGSLGWPEQAPFDAILSAAAVNHIPRVFLEQLDWGARLILPLGDYRIYQELTLIRKTRNGIKKSYITDVRFVPMTGRVKKTKE